MRLVFIFAFKNVSRTLSDFARAMWICVVRVCVRCSMRMQAHKGTWVRNKKVLTEELGATYLLSFMGRNEMTNM